MIATELRPIRVVTEPGVAQFNLTCLDPRQTPCSERCCVDLLVFSEPTPLRGDAKQGLTDFGTIWPKALGQTLAFIRAGSHFLR